MHAPIAPRNDGSLSVAGRVRAFAQRYGWWLVPLLGLAELGASRYFAARAPSQREWHDVAADVRALRAHDELIVVAPHWAEPLAREAFDPALLPLVDLARPDARSYARAVEVSALGVRDPELAGWRVVEQRSAGRFQLRVLENPAPFQVATNFVDRVATGAAEVFVDDDGKRWPCRWNVRSDRRTGGLHGDVAFPAQRFQCERTAEYFVGVTLIDDQEYRARRCIWAHPPRRGALVVRFNDVKLGSVVRGYAGLSYFLARDGIGTPVKIEVKVDPLGSARSLGSYEHRDEWGWRPFELAQGAPSENASIEFRISSANPKSRDFCFFAESGQ